MKNQTNLKYSCNPKDIFKSAKKKLEKLHSKEDSLKLAYLKLKKKTIQLLQG